MPTSYATEYTTIASYFETQWAGETLIRGVDAKKPTDEKIEWVRLTVLPIDADQRTLADTPSYRHRGFVVVQVFTPRGQGPARNNTLCDTVVGIFRGVTNSGITYGRPDPVKEPGFEPEGSAWFAQNVRAGFWWDDT